MQYLRQNADSVWKDIKPDLPVLLPLNFNFLGILKKRKNLEVLHYLRTDKSMIAMITMISMCCTQMQYFLKVRKMLRIDEMS